MFKGLFLASALVLLAGCSTAYDISTPPRSPAQSAQLKPSRAAGLPIVKVAPIYPVEALSKGQEGWVLVEFAVDKNGVPSNLKVVDSSPEGVFDRAAMKAASQFRYKPRVVDGVAVPQPRVQNLITFSIAH